MIVEFKRLKVFGLDSDGVHRVMPLRVEIDPNNIPPCANGACGVCWVCKSNKESELQTMEHRSNGPCGEPECGVCYPSDHSNNSILEAARRGQEAAARLIRRGQRKIGNE